MCGLHWAVWFLIIIIAVETLNMLLSMILPSVQQAREAGRHQACLNNLRTIGQAMRNYHDAHGCFPPPYTVDENGNPLHSWRVLILPYLERGDLYEQIRLDEPWNSPHNRRFATMSVYQCPSDPDQPGHYTTDYLMITGPGTVGDGPNGTTLREITDGPANTLLIAETRNSGVNWMQPVDLDAETMPRRINDGSDPSDPLSIASYHPGLANVLFCDGSVRSLSDETPAETVEAILTTSGGEPVELPDP